MVPPKLCTHIRCASTHIAMCIHAIVHEHKASLHCKTMCASPPELLEQAVTPRVVRLAAEPCAALLMCASIMHGCRRMHGAHHKAPFEGNYCIVSGLWNPLLDETRFFRKLEDFFFATTKVEPRCWYPPDDDWAEMQKPSV